MKQLKLEFTEAGPLYKCDEGIYYQFNSSGDLVFLSEDNIDGAQVWNYATGSFKINDDKDIYQTQEYYDKYYVCGEKEQEKRSRVSIKGDRLRVFTYHLGSDYSYKEWVIPTISSQDVVDTLVKIIESLLVPTEIRNRTDWKEKEIDKIYVALSSISADNLIKDPTAHKRYETFLGLIYQLERLQ